MGPRSFMSHQFRRAPSRAVQSRVLSVGRMSSWVLLRDEGRPVEHVCDLVVSNSLSPTTLAGRGVRQNEQETENSRRSPKEGVTNPATPLTATVLAVRTESDLAHPFVPGTQPGAWQEVGAHVLADEARGMPAVSAHGSVSVFPAWMGFCFRETMPQTRSV